jgi:hypothetical protein
MDVEIASRFVARLHTETAITGDFPLVQLEAIQGGSSSEFSVACRPAGGTP